ncbi:putative Glycosyltransferase subfamily 4-like domain-containing protein [Helianthus annuus]|uniref:Glycosyltransferase subfamily 4-like domain-containing protein n=1 Tax=Helianthus annuus TaxID=4232 RepID=A0A9K3EJ01_HELAN|nr:putative Glycosyltransferase subfamily 4-like domain-containing protein [Helianthus annuus]KAJ0849928.1 putative Glycosyltransferase subfamily 4-like domain-containing protein [Helianthus annuus]
MVVTTHEGVLEEFHGAKLVGSRSFSFPWYQQVPLSLALSPRIINEVKQFKLDIIHASSPGIMVFGALTIAKMLSVPIVMSYHTHVPVYQDTRKVSRRFPFASRGVSIEAERGVRPRRY